MEHCCKFSALKIAGVERPWRGLARDKKGKGGGGKLGTCSPLPVTKAVPCEKKKATSEPSSGAQVWSSSSEMGKWCKALSPQRVVAALLLPPPSPACTGIFFSRWMCAWN